jgi:DNA-binding GntR family transcriptional regulator
MTVPAPPAPRIVVDRSSPVPLYFQVATQLERAIDEGALPPGSRLENEAELAQRLGLSRPTMRQAMQHLSDKGLIVRRRGVGTTVTESKIRRPVELSSLYDDLVRSGQRPVTQVLDLTEEEATSEVAAALGVAERAPVVVLRRIRSAGGRPIALMTNYLPSGLVDLSEGELRVRGLYELLRGAGVVMHAATQVVGARLATKEEAGLLDEEPAAALLTMERQTYDQSATVVEFGRHVYAASRYSLEMSLHIG